MASDQNFKGREQLFKNKGKDVDVSVLLWSQILTNSLTQKTLVLFVLILRISDLVEVVLTRVKPNSVIWQLRTASSNSKVDLGLNNRELEVYTSDRDQLLTSKRVETTISCYVY